MMDATPLMEQLLAVASGHPNTVLLAQLIVGQRRGAGCLPEWLGLAPDAYARLLQRHFPGALFWLERLAPLTGDVRERAALRGQLQVMRDEEWREIRDLLLAYRAGLDESEVWVAAIVASGCLGGDHLWRDLGLPDRQALSELLRTNFPVLTARNDRDMKWKKFFYRQLCEQEGGYVCRAPSCEACAGYSDCFGAEI